MARDLRLQITGDSKSAERALDNVADESDRTAATLRGLGQEMKAAARDGQKLERQLDDIGGPAKVVSAELGGTAKQADRAAAEMREAARAVEKLDAQMAVARVEIARLNKELGETGDAKAVKVLQQQYNEYDRIAKLKKRIQQQDEQAAAKAKDPLKEIERQYRAIDRTARLKKRIAKDEEAAHKENERRNKELDRLDILRRRSGRSRFRNGLSDLFGAGKEAGGAVVSSTADALNDIPGAGIAKIAIGTSAAPAIGSLAGASLLAGGAFAGAGLGIAGAVAGNPEAFQKKWTAAIAEVTNRWKMASLGFEKPALQAFDILKSAVDNIHLEEALKSAEKYVVPLARGIAGFITPLANGIAKLVEKAGPVVEVLSNDLPLLGKAFEQAFSDVGEGAGGAARALHDLIGYIAIAIVAVGQFIEVVEKAYKYLNPVPPVLGKLATGTQYAGRALESSAKSADMFAKSEKSLSDSMKEVNDALGSQLNAMLALDRANDAASDGVERLKEAFKKNGNAIDGNSEKAKANREVLQGVIEDYFAQRDAAIAAGDQSAVSMGKANAVLRQHLEDLRAVLKAHGDDTSALDKYIDELDSLDGKVVKVKVDVHYQEYNPGIALGNLLHHARGGETLGGPVMVGEHGPEIVWSDRGQYVSTTEQTQRLASMMGSASGGTGGSGPVQLVVAPGADKGVADLIQYLLDRNMIQAFAGGELVTTRRG